VVVQSPHLAPEFLPERTHLTSGCLVQGAHFLTHCGKFIPHFGPKLQNLHLERRDSCRKFFERRHPLFQNLNARNQIAARHAALFT
jgi:hypothetical protein